MAQINRFDGPGAWHHVYNRGIGKRLLFANRQDYRKFLSLLARAVRRGEIEVHSDCLLGTHFHLLVRTPDGGDLSRAMMRIQNAYARWFNRRNRRDGTLFRGRFRSKLVTSSAYWLTLLRYIDFNAVSAHICEHPAAYPYGSARAYCQGQGPKWLDMTAVREILEVGSGPADLASAYVKLLGVSLSDDESDLIEARLRGPVSDDPLDDLLTATSARFQSWITWKARLADGLKPSLPLASVSSVRSRVDRSRASRGDLPIKRTRTTWDGWTLIEAGLLHEIAGCSCERIAHTLDCNNATASRWIRAHRSLLADDSSDYAELSSAIAQGAIQDSVHRRSRP